MPNCNNLETQILKKLNVVVHLFILCSKTLDVQIDISFKTFKLCLKGILIRLKMSTVNHCDQNDDPHYRCFSQIVEILQIKLSY